MEDQDLVLGKDGNIHVVRRYDDVIFVKGKLELKKRIPGW